MEEATPLYTELSEYHQRCLPATNFWRIANGLQPIVVPKTDKAYYQYFTKESVDKAKRIYETGKWRNGVIQSQRIVSTTAQDAVVIKMITTPAAEETPVIENKKPETQKNKSNKIQPPPGQLF